MAMSVRTDAVGGIRRWWPALAGVAVAGLVGFDLTAGAAPPAPVLAAAAVVYLGAAALQRREAAWPLFLGTFVLITVAEVVPGLPDPTHLLLGAGALLLGYGLVRGAVRPASGLPLQTLAAVGFGGAALLALEVRPELSGYLVGAGLLAHAAWDVHHHRTGRVVSRSLAQCCAVLDALLAVAVLAVTVLA